MTSRLPSGVAILGASYWLLRLMNSTIAREVQQLNLQLVVPPKQAAHGKGDDDQEKAKCACLEGSIDGIVKH